MLLKDISATKGYVYVVGSMLQPHLSWTCFMIFVLPVLYLEFVEVKVTSSCANLLVINNNASGIIRSSQRSYYSDNMNCQWSLTSNVRLELVFLNFITHSSADYVNVYDGGSQVAPLIGTFSGPSLPAPIMSSSNKLYVTFTTDSAGRNEGFTATYRGRKHCNLF